MASGGARSLAVIALLVATSAAHAHLRFGKFAGERKITLHLAADPVRVTYELGFGADAAKKDRALADSNRDGAVSAVEGNAALDSQSRTLLDRVALCTGESLDALACAPPIIERALAEGWTPDAAGHLHFTWTLRSEAKQFTAIRVDDSFDVAPVGITDVTIEPPLASKLTAAGPDARDGVTTEIVWLEAQRPPGPRVVRAAWQRTRTVPWLAFGAIAAVATTLAAFLVARRRQ